ncbi:MAG: molybdenum cofactor biosynthesis protein MoaE [Gammaproteobacteria bacterium]|nr:molybdenum cofactor biosynthesis protein MoaE [Gammaproteobacteria bacterium]
MSQIRIQERDFSLSDEYELFRRSAGGKAGAIASFVGLVRDTAKEEQVKGLILEHYPGMTEKSIEKIVSQSYERWRLLDVLVIHRIGHLRPTDQIVLVLVASSHRPDAFAACEYVMDLLKTEAVFWKKEVQEKSTVWIESTADDHSRRDQWHKTEKVSTR